MQPPPRGVLRLPERGVEAPGEPRDRPERDLGIEQPAAGIAGDDEVNVVDIRAERARAAGLEAGRPEVVKDAAVGKHDPRLYFLTGSQRREPPAAVEGWQQQRVRGRS